MATDSCKTTYYTASHEWLLCVDDGVRLGITQYAQQQLGEIVFVELPVADRVYKKDQTICVVESIKTASEIDVPFSCRIVAINHSLSTSPGMMNTSPQSEGWICIVRPDIDDWQSSLMNQSEYFDLLSEGNTIS